jgi:hypothetical protein
MHMMCRRGMTHDVSCQTGNHLVGRRFTFATPEKLRAAAQSLVAPVPILNNGAAPNAYVARCGPRLGKTRDRRYSYSFHSGLRHE